MGIAWVFCAPVAIAVSWCRSLFPKDLAGLWFKIHVSLTSICALFTIIAFGIAVHATNAAGSPKYNGTHQRVGLTIFISFCGVMSFVQFFDLKRLYLNPMKKLSRVLVSEKSQPRKDQSGSSATPYWALSCLFWGCTIQTPARSCMVIWRFLAQKDTSVLGGVGTSFCFPWRFVSRYITSMQRTRRTLEDSRSRRFFSAEGSEK